MGRKASTQIKRGKNGHRALSTLCTARKVKLTDIAAALQMTPRNAVRLTTVPLRMNGYQQITVAGLLGITPEYLVYVIRFNKLHENPPETTTEIKDFEVRFPT